jgi:hypothetical protein
MISKLKTSVWYLKQPKGYQLLFNLVKQKTIYKQKENTRNESIEWCAERSEDTTVALSKLFPGSGENFADIEKIYPNEFHFASQQVEITPFQMGGAGNMNLLYNICETIQAQYVAETGVAYGWSSLSILLSISKRKDSLLISTDMPYAKMGNQNSVGVVVPPHLRKNWLLIQESDISGLSKGLKKTGCLDVVHYDSDKSYLGRMKTYPVLYDKLRRGGVFISDDIQDNIGFKDFCEKLKIIPTIISFEGKYIGVFIK